MRRIPSPLVAHRHAHAAVRGGRGDDDVGAGRGVGEGVVEEDAQDLSDADGIERRLRRLVART